MGVKAGFHSRIGAVPEIRSTVSSASALSSVAPSSLHCVPPTIREPGQIIASRFCAQPLHPAATTALRANSPDGNERSAGHAAS